MRKTKLAGKSGQTLVEFALILPIFFLIVVVIFDLGRAVYYSSAIHNAAREGARWGIVYPNIESNIKGKAINYGVGLGLAPGNITVCWHYNPSDTHSFPPPSVKVTVTYRFRPVTPLVADFISGGQITLKGEAVMKLEELPDAKLINNCRY